MKLTASQLKAQARGHLAGRYTLPIMAYIIARLLTNIPSMVVSYTTQPYTVSGYLIDFAVSLILSFIMAIFTVGQRRIFLTYARSDNLLPLSEMWYGFKGRADEIIITLFWIYIRCFAVSVPFIVSLSVYLTQPVHNELLLLISFLLAVFMIVMLIRLELDYALVFFLMIDYPQKRPQELLLSSKQLMEGNRGRLLYLQLSFIGMFLLVLLSFGIALFWVYPYLNMTLTEFYLDVKEVDTQSADAQQSH
jgi:uncharacterized membrane protein